MGYNLSRCFKNFAKENMRLGSKKMKEGMCQRKGNVAERKLTHSGQADR